MVDIEEQRRPSAGPVRQVRGTVLVPLDPIGAPTPALDVAGSLARQAGMPLELLAVPSHRVGSSGEVLLEGPGRQVAMAGAPAVSRTMLPPGPPASLVLAHANVTRPALICMATHARGVVGELLLGSVSEAVLRRSPVPVVMVGPHVVRASGGVRRVTVALDGFEPAERALTVASRLARWLGVPLSFVEVVTGPARQGPGVRPSAYLERVASRVPRPAPSFETLHGDHVARTLAEWVKARDGALLVMGTHGRAGLARLALGSTALDVVRRARGPVLLVPPWAEVPAEGAS